MNMNRALLAGETLLDRLRDPNSDMSFMDKLGASIQVTILGVFIVVVALVLLYFAINIMERLLREPKKSSETVSKEAPVKTPVSEPVKEESTSLAEQENEELVAVITAAIAASMETSTHNIVVRNIVRTGDTTPAWGKAGRVEQINQMYRV